MEIAAPIERGFKDISDPEKAKIERTWPVPEDAGRNEIVVVACARNYLPFPQLGTDGKAYGMLIDLWPCGLKRPAGQMPISVPRAHLLMAG